MISLRRHIDGSHRQTLSESSLPALRSLVLTMNECGQKAVPLAAAGLREKLGRIDEGLSISMTPEQLAGFSRKVQSEFARWAERAERHHQDNEREIREIISLVGSAAGSISERDERYAREIGDVTGRLQGVADSNDVSLIRRSIIENTKALKDCVQKMAENSRESVHQLKSEIGEYRKRLEASERMSAIEPLTGLASRRAFERQLDASIASRNPFCLILLDLDDFKSTNDTHGHLAGDDLLRKFAAEMKAHFAPADLVARWGGDEFAMLVPGLLSEGMARVERVKRWALGEYKVKAGEKIVKVSVAASIGVVQWATGENGADLLDRADKSVYRAKALRHSAA